MKPNVTTSRWADVGTGANKLKCAARIGATMDMLQFTNVLITNTREIPCGFAHRKDDADNLYYALFFADENNNLMWLDLELWNQFYGGIQHGKVYPVVGEIVSQDYEQVQDPEDYLVALQDVGIIGPDVYIDSYIEPFEVSRY